MVSNCSVSLWLLAFGLAIRNLNSQVIDGDGDGANATTTLSPEKEAQDAIDSFEKIAADSADPDSIEKGFLESLAKVDEENHVNALIDKITPAVAQKLPVENIQTIFSNILQTNDTSTAGKALTLMANKLTAVGIASPVNQPQQVNTSQDGLETIYANYNNGQIQFVFDSGESATFQAANRRMVTGAPHVVALTRGIRAPGGLVHSDKFKKCELDSQSDASLLVVDGGTSAAILNEIQPAQSGKILHMMQHSSGSWRDAPCAAVRNTPTSFICVPFPGNVFLLHLAQCDGLSRGGGGLAVGASGFRTNVFGALVMLLFHILAN